MTLDRNCSTPDLQSECFAIVGGGVIGLSLAWELRRRGFNVTVLERDKIKDSTSRVASGILPPANLASASDPIDALRGYSHSLFPRWSKDLMELTGIDIGLRRCGGWYFANTPGELALMTGMIDYWAELDIQCERVGLDEVATREPNLRHWTQSQSVAQAWWVADEYQIRPPEYLKALHAACELSGVSVIEDSLITDLMASNDHVRLKSNGIEESFSAVILCGGSWTGRIDDCLNLSQSLIPIRGQLLVLKSDESLLRSIVNLGNRYIVCREDGHTVVGSCEEEVGFDRSTTPEMIEALNCFAIDLIPGLKSAATVATFSGLRPLTFDGFPMIGRVPNQPRLFTASGHYRSGIHLSPGTAVCLAEEICGGTPIVPLDAFRIGKQQTAEARC